MFTDRMQPHVKVRTLAGVTASLGLLLGGLQGVASTDGAKHPVTFQITVDEGRIPGSVGGQVFLTSDIDPGADRVLPLNQAVDLPTGRWSWQAEAPGLVTVGWNAVPEALAGRPQLVTARALPSCEASLLKPLRGAAPDRVRVVSPDVSTIYDVDVTKRPRWQVPAGRFFLLTYRQGVLTGLDASPRSCKKGESVSLPLPTSPGNAEHAMLLSLRLPEAKLKLADLGLSLRPSGPRRELRVSGPAQVVGMGPHVLALFPRVPAGQEAELRLKHPKLRSLVLDFPAPGGGLTALPEQTLRLRPTLTIPIDYRPARSHRVQKVQGYFCGPRNLAANDDIVDFETCDRLGLEYTLHPGLHEYSFPDLDTGQYVFNAQFESELVYALANWCVPFLKPEADAFDEIAPVPLREFQVFGHILQGDEPVPGFVRVFNDAYQAPEIVAQTGDDLLYHLYYFGHRLYPQSIRSLPPSAQKVPKGEIWGLTYGVFFSACSSAGSCVAYPQGARIAGEGRFDFQIGDDTGVEVRVIDAETRKPLSHARVFPMTPKTEKVFQFFDGEVTLSPRLTLAGFTNSGLDGTVRLRMPHGLQQVGVAHEDYEPDTGKIVDVTIPEDGWTELEVELERSRKAETDVQFVLVEGRPAGRAFLPVFDPQGSRRLGCATSTRPNGVVRFPPGCLAGAVVALLHSDATVSFFRGDDLARGGTFQVQPAPRLPGRVRVLAEDGLPVVGATLAVAFGRIVLEPVDFNIAYGMGSGPILVGPSDAEGIIVLRGINLAPGAAPSVAVIGEKPGQLNSLAALEPGEILDVEAP